MGDMADMELDAVLDEEDARLDFLTGHMSDLEAFDRGILNPLGGLVGTERPYNTRGTRTSRIQTRTPNLMPNLSDMKPAHPKILIYGPPGAGKTLFAATLGAGLHVLDFDGGLGSCLTFQDAHTSARKSIEYTDCREKSPMSATGFSQAQGFMAKASQFKGTAIAIDSFTAMAEGALRQAHVAEGGKMSHSGFTISQYGKAFFAIEQFIMALRTAPVTVVAVFHQMEFLIDDQQHLTMAIPGQKLAPKIPIHFDEIWYLKPRLVSGKMKYAIQTKASPSITARSRYQIPNHTPVDAGLPKILSDAGVSL